MKGAIQNAIDVLKQGSLVAFPTETVYSLGARVFDPVAVSRIFLVKGRPADNPLIVHVAAQDQLKRVVSEVPPMAKRLMDVFWPGPQTLVLKRSPQISPLISAGLDTVAIRCPDHPVALALIRGLGEPIAAPSANRSGRPSPTRMEGPFYYQRVCQHELDYARHLFSALLEAEQSGVEVLLAEMVKKEGLGIAIMNRLERAARVES